MCEFFHISRAAYYAWAKRAEQPDKDRERMRLVQVAWEKSRKTYGYRRVTIYLQQNGHQINHKAVLRLMNKLGIRSVARKPKRYQRKSKDIYHRYDNVLDRDFSATALIRNGLRIYPTFPHNKGGPISPRSRICLMVSSLPID